MPDALECDLRRCEVVTFSLVLASLQMEDDGMLPVESSGITFTNLTAIWFLGDVE